MAFNNIEEFIHQYKLNYSPNHLRKHLIDQGYPEKQINKSIKKAYKDVLEATIQSYLHTHHKQEIHKYLVYAGHHPKEIEKAMKKALIKYVKKYPTIHPHSMKKKLKKLGHTSSHINHAIQEVHSPNVKYIKFILIALIPFLLAYLLVYSTDLQYNSLCSNDDFKTIHHTNNQKIIPDINSVIKFKTALQLNNLEQIESFSKLKCIQQLDLSDFNITSLEQLQKLSRLEYLDLSSNPLIDIAFIEEFHNLEYLDLSHNNIIDISSLAKLTKLKTLKLANNKIMDISSLAELENLEALTLDNNPVTEIAYLSQLTNLKSLSLQKSGVRDISPLQFTNIEELKLGGAKVVSYDPLFNMTMLKTVNLNYAYGSSISPRICIQLSSLTNVDIRGC